MAVVVGRFGAPAGDLDVLGSLLRRRDLSDDRVQDEQAAGRSGDRQFHEQLFIELSLGKVDGRSMGAASSFTPRPRMASGGAATLDIRYGKLRLK